MNIPNDADGALVQEVLQSSGQAAAPPPPVAPEVPDPFQQEELPEFDPRYRDEFEGLLYVGHLQDTVVFMGHKFRLVTPSSADRLQIALLCKPYNETIGFEFAYSCALVAAYLVSVDGRDLPMPITNDPKDTALPQRFEWVLQNLKKVVIDHLYNECLNLDATVREVLEAMGKALG